MEIVSLFILYQAVYAGTCAKSLERCISFAKWVLEWSRLCLQRQLFQAVAFFCSCVYLRIIQLQS
jgi:hypothetical protein